MSAKVDLAAHFQAMERLIEVEPEGTRVELAHGVFMMSPRPRFRHTVVQARLASLVNPIELMPEWVAEVLSPATETYDREEKLSAYGLMGVGWAWLVDVDARRVESFSNVRGKMIAGPSAGDGDELRLSPFESAALSLAELFAFR